MSDHPHHHHGCDCHAHRIPSVARSESPSAWETVLPILACAVCPACLTTYAKLLSVAGVGFGLDERLHAVLLFVAIAASVGLSAYRSHRTRRLWPIAFAVGGASAVLLGHLVPSLHALEWVGVAVMLVGGLREHVRFVLARTGGHATA